MYHERADTAGHLRRMKWTSRLKKGFLTRFYSPEATLYWYTEGGACEHPLLLHLVEEFCRYSLRQRLSISRHNNCHRRQHNVAALYLQCRVPQSRGKSFLCHRISGYGIFDHHASPIYCQWSFITRRYKFST